MTHVISSLRSALSTQLLADHQLISSLGGQNIFVVAPPGQALPYITFGKAMAEDWRMAGVVGHHQTLSLDIWTREGGDQEALSLSQRVVELIDGKKLTLEGHSLIDLRVVSQVIDPIADNGITHAHIYLDAYTEVSL